VTPESSSLDLPEENSSLDLDLVASALRADLNDISAFVEGLAVRLEQALPGFVKVTRTRQGFRGPKLVSEIAVETADGKLELIRQGGDVRAMRSRTSGGIVLKREEVGVDDWLTALTSVAAEQAQRSERTRQALQKLVLDQ
jgi:hypothetical protein